MAGKLKGKLVFLGAGNMAEALVHGIVKGKVCLPADITVTDLRRERLEHFEKTFGVRADSDSAGAAREADLLVLAVKPQSLREVLGEIKGSLDRKRTCVLSIAAGITARVIESELGEGARVVRSMPNTPALVGAGVAAICGGQWAKEEDLLAAEALLGAAGLVVRVAEKDMDAVTAVSGSGPAYVFFLIEAMLEGAKRLGLEETTARSLVLATVAGAARMCSETGEDPAVLRERVTSRGGTTAAALEVLRAKGVFEAWVEAIAAAHARSRELSQS
ncbi:MAG: pyrroline-5-carboxylate reductase [Kiritimatiellae bacterium]|nr:pyrroline-5-carboxylate reductase [Kiritimatiellia bacterium]